LTGPRRHLTDHGIFGTPGDVSPWEVAFDPRDVAFLERVASGGLRLRLWAEPRLSEATVVVRTAAAVSSHPMRAIGSGGTSVLWEAEVLEADGFEFSFAFRTPQGRPVYVCPSGITSAIERLDRWTVAAGAARPVSWARGAVVYQIFPDRFADGDPSLDPPGTLPWGDAPRPAGFFGGDLAGITSRLDYLGDLGVEVLYLNPVFASPSNHRYDASDYFSVDPRLGGDAALRDLVAAVHRRGMRLLLDVSLNHCHPRFFAFADVVARGPASEFAEWFVVRDWPIRVGYRPHLLRDPGWVDRLRSETGVAFEEIGGEGPPFEPGYECWYGVPTMPRFDLTNPGARAYLLGVARHWVESFDIDGWRMDVTRYVDPDFWPEVRSTVQAVRPDAYFLAEVFGDVGRWLQGDAFDGTMNYTFRDLASQFIATRTIDGPEFLEFLTRLWGRYGEEASLCNHNLLGSHDVPRFRTVAGGDQSAFHLATALQFLFPGMPGVYYGDEVGLEGGEDPECRGTFPWDPDPRLHPSHRFIKGLVEVRRQWPVLRSGRFEPVMARRDLIAFARGEGDDRLVVVLNRGARAARLDLPATAVLWGDAEAGEQTRIAARSAAVVVPRVGGYAHR
jgi:cyclomaltodextrinase / maltogenic alpha-amylase / neopullulanase